MPSLNTKLASAPNTQTNYVLKATSSTTIGNSLIQDDGTNVAIGTTPATYKLNVNGTLGVTAAATFSSSVTAAGAIYAGSTSRIGFGTSAAERGAIILDASYNWTINTNGVAGAMYITSATGAATFSSNVTTNGTYFVQNTDYNSGTATGTNFRISLNASSGNTYTRLQTYTDGGGTYGNIILNALGGNVGIGTSLPSTILHVVDTSANDTTLTLGTTNEIPTIKAGGSNTDLRLEAIGSGGNLYFTTNGNLRTTITSGGALALGTSNSNGFTFRISSNANNNSDAKKVMQLGNDVVNSVSAYMYIGSYAGIDWLVGKDTSGAGDYRFNLSLYTGEQRMVLYTNGNYSFAGSNVSDIRLKSNINTLDVNALDKITHFVPKSYYMTDNPEQIRYGFIAQEIGELVPDLVTGEEKEQEYLGLDYNGVLTLAVKAIQELNQKVTDQQQQINQLINK